MSIHLFNEVKAGTLRAKSENTRSKIPKEETISDCLESIYILSLARLTGHFPYNRHDEALPHMNNFTHDIKSFV